MTLLDLSIKAVAVLTRLIGGDLRARTHASMLPPGDPRGKYITRHTAITDVQIAAHLAGTETYAVKLVGRDGFARAWVADVDTGGREAVRARVETLTAAGLPCLGFAAKGAGDHDGGHLWGEYEHPVTPEAARAQVKAVLDKAGLPTPEIWPSGVHIRAPFGVHTHTGQRGVLIRPGLPDVSLDTDEGLEIGIAALIDLQPSPPPPPMPPAKGPVGTPVLLQPPQQQVGGRRVGRANARAIIAQFNAEHPIEDLLRRYSCTRTRDGWALNDGVAHANETQAAVSDRGLLVFYTSRSPWAPNRTDCNGRPIADAFDLYTQVEHGGDKTAALKAINPIPARPAQGYYPPPPSIEDRRHTDPATVESRAKEAQHKRDARRAEAASILADVRARAAEDPILARRPAERTVLHALLDTAGDRDWCRPSKARLTEMTRTPDNPDGYSLGAVKRALMDLETRGYFESQGDGGGPRCTAVRTFLRGSPREKGGLSASTEDKSPPDLSTGITPEEETGRSYGDQVIHESIGIEDLEYTYRAGEGGASLHTSPADDPGPLSETGWATLLECIPPVETELFDPGAMAAWDVSDGLCAIPALLCPPPPAVTVGRDEPDARPSPAPGLASGAARTYGPQVIPNAPALDRRVDAEQVNRENAPALDRLTDAEQVGGEEGPMPNDTGPALAHSSEKANETTALDAQPAPATAPPTLTESTVEASSEPVGEVTRRKRCRLRDTASPAWHFAQLEVYYQLEAERRASINEPEPEPLPELPPLRTVKGPPRDAGVQRRYYALLGKARKAKSANQRRALRAQAAVLEEWYAPEELARGQGARPAAPLSSQMRMILPTAEG